MNQIEAFTWQHKKTKKKFCVIPWYEILKDDTILSEKNLGDMTDDGRKFKIGALVQVGWLIKNEHEVFFGVSLEVEKEFKNLGEWKVKKKPEKKKTKNKGEKDATQHGIR